MSWLDTLLGRPARTGSHRGQGRATRTRDTRYVGQRRADERPRHKASHTPILYAGRHRASEPVGGPAYVGSHRRQPSIFKPFGTRGELWSIDEWLKARGYVD